ncbi:MAG: hypothetical protein RMK89_11205 [Armatimonadota bacterium]|nr:hypothetical protein [Armatimonadota bacterium]MDW8144016.1 hypothetical protein [Armatimonadota bacterium]
MNRSILKRLLAGVGEGETRPKKFRAWLSLPLQPEKVFRSLLQSLLALCIHATGFSQWLMTNLQAPNLFGENFFCSGG